MSPFKFEWNVYADQPHNVAPRSERTRHHFEHWRTYLTMLGSNLVHGGPTFAAYRRNRRTMYRSEIPIESGMFGLAVSPGPVPGDDVFDFLEKSGARRVLFRIPSWEKERLDEFADFARALKSRGFETVIALLQRREDVFRLDAWSAFLDEVFSRFRSLAEGFEIGHAWNRTKWGVWDYSEYVRLAQAAVALRQKYGVKLIGPAVIDFEFHLYPPVLRAVDFQIVSALLYVDRVGAPENAQYGFTAEMKMALYQAFAQSGAGRRSECWVTEVNWPLAGTGKFSPASGKPNVDEDEQANYLVRYDVLALASGLIGRVYWWQLAAPGYGLVDPRKTPWRRRPSFEAFRTMISELSGSIFVRRERPNGGDLFYFRKNGRELAVAWTNGAAFEHSFGRPVRRITGRDGEDLRPSEMVRIGGRPQYVFF
jgi:hypothetical protein